jgi:hypothetical protein
MEQVSRDIDVVPGNLRLRGFSAEAAKPASNWGTIAVASFELRPQFVVKGNNTVDQLDGPWWSMSASGTANFCRVHLRIALPTSLHEAIYNTAKRSPGIPPRGVLRPAYMTAPRRNSGPPGEKELLGPSAGSALRRVNRNKCSSL